MPDFLVPDLGEGLREATIVTWHVSVGDHVEVDEIVVELETAKAAVEVPVPFGGTVVRLLGGPGTTVKVGEPLLTVVPADSIGSTRAGFSASPGESPHDATQGGTEDRPSSEPSGNVLIGYGTGSTSEPRRRRPIALRHGRSGSADAAPVPPRPSAGTNIAADERPIRVISPLVRTLARDANVDLSTITPTGPSSTIRRQDVEEAIARTRDRAGTPSVPPPTKVGEVRIPLTGVRRTVADKLERSRREIPEATVWVDVDLTDLLAARLAFNARAGSPISILTLLVRFTVSGLRRFPELNARLDDGEIVIPDHVHIGLAVQTDRGLVVPVIHHAERMSAGDLAISMAARIEAARTGRLAPSDLTGGTITVNNYGVFGVDGSAAIINPPEVAIVGLGRIIDRPWVVAGQVVPRRVTQLSLAFDHRVCDGGTAGGFLRYLADCLEKPLTALVNL